MNYAIPLAMVEMACGQASLTTEETKRVMFCTRQRLETLRYVAKMRDPGTGRLDAKRVARFFFIPASSVARMLHVSPQAVSQNPTARSYQEKLQLLERIVSILCLHMGNNFRPWFWSSNPYLEWAAPMEVILDGNAAAALLALEKQAA